MVLGKKVAFFYWEGGRKSPGLPYHIDLVPLYFLPKFSYHTV